MAASCSSNSSVPGGFTCCVPGCFNNSKKHKGQFSFYKFPADKKLRKKWLINISRKDFSPKLGHRVCSSHFEGGTKTFLNNVPTVFPLQKTHQTAKKAPRRVLVRHEQEISTEPEIETEVVDAPSDDIDTSSNHEEDIQLLKEKVKSLELINSKLELDNSFGVEKFQSSDDDIRYYTGMENYKQFKALYDFLDGEVGACSRLNFWGSNNSSFQMEYIDKRGKKRRLLPIDELFMTMARLRVNLPEKILADWYKISTSEVSRIFVTWLNFLFTRLTQLPTWASRETVNKTMPECFKYQYPFTRIILDCTEIFIEKPSCFRAQSETYSTYKSHNTAKGLVGISPQGAVTFVSDLFGGHASDRKIVESCGIVSLLLGDSVMADKGFRIQDLI